MTQSAVEFSPSVDALEQAAEAARAAMNDGNHLEAFYRWLDIQHRSPGHPEAYYSAGQALRALRNHGDMKMELESNIYGGIPLKGDGTIAIVGNSPNVKDRGYGAEIDKHDTVLRINRAWNKINEADLGAKTSVLFLGHFPKKYINDYKKITPHADNILSLMSNWENISQLGTDWGKVFFVRNYRPFFMRGVYKILGSYIGKDLVHQRAPRSGICMIALMLLLGKGQTPIDLYGFEDRDNTGPGWKEHLYSDGAVGNFTHVKYHCPPELEFEMLRRLREKGLIRINT